jgi:hypothetical protein
MYTLMRIYVIVTCRALITTAMMPSETQGTNTYFMRRMYIHMKSFTVKTRRAWHRGITAAITRRAWHHGITAAMEPIERPTPINIHIHGYVGLRAQKSMAAAMTPIKKPRAISPRPTPLPKLDKSAGGSVGVPFFCTHMHYCHQTHALLSSNTCTIVIKHAHILLS